MGGVRNKDTGKRAATVAKTAYRNTVFSIFSTPPTTGVSFLEHLRYNVSSPEQLEDIFGKQEEGPNESV